MLALRLIFLTGLSLWLTSNVKVLWYWVRARRMLSHLPRLPEDSTLLGYPKEAVGPRRHFIYRGPRARDLAVLHCEESWLGARALNWLK
jgi:hypothetical protein